MTRMYSCRMRTVRSSSHLLGGCLPRGVSGQGGVSAQGGLPEGGFGVSQHAQWQTTPPPVNRMTDRQVWKNYLSATSWVIISNRCITEPQSVLVDLEISTVRTQLDYMLKILLEVGWCRFKQVNLPFVFLTINLFKYEAIGFNLIWIR